MPTISDVCKTWPIIAANVHDMSKGAAPLRTVDPTTDTPKEVSMSTTLVPTTQDVFLQERLEQLAAIAKFRLAHAKAPATITAYKSDMDHYIAWCAGYGLESLPTASDTLIQYLFDHEESLAPATLSRRLSAIKRIHEVEHHPDPVTKDVKDALVAIKREKGTRQRRAGALSPADLNAAIGALDLTHRRGIRDRAILLLGFAGGFRRSELAALNTDDVVDDPAGLRVYVARGKSDQLGEGFWKKIHYGTDLCPVLAIRSWIKVAGIADGMLFRPVTHGGAVGLNGISTKTINRVVKHAAAAAGLDETKFSAHSLRRGHASTAIRNGANDHDVMATVGWKSIEMVRTYYADVEGFTPADSSAMLGL